MPREELSAKYRFALEVISWLRKQPVPTARVAPGDSGSSTNKERLPSVLSSPGCRSRIVGNEHVRQAVRYLIRKMP